MRIERVGLEHDADIAVLRLDIVDHLIVEQQVAAGGQVDAGEDEQAGRLAAAGRAEQRDELAVGDLEVHAGNHLDVPEALDDVAELDPGHP